MGLYPFQNLRGLIEADGRGTNPIGSAYVDLLKQFGETLQARIATLRCIQSHSQNFRPARQVDLVQSRNGSRSLGQRLSFRVDT